MTSTSRWWEDYRLAATLDIRKLRPSSQLRGKRFETLNDARTESARSEKVLRKVGHFTAAEYLNDCRSGRYACRKTFCPICARRYRLALIGEELRLFARYESASLAVVLLDEAPGSMINRLDPKRHKQWIRKRLNRAGYDQFPVIVAFENVYKARAKKWVLHANICIFGTEDIDALETTFKTAKRKGVQCDVVKNPAEQLSYVPKFTTYHRPRQQQGKVRGTAMPLNDREHGELVTWMGKRGFNDFLLLINARRRGDHIEAQTQMTR